MLLNIFIYYQYRYTQDYNVLLEAVKKSEILQYNETCWTIRRKEGWEIWRVPRDDGVLGLPRYKPVKQSE